MPFGEALGPVEAGLFGSLKELTNGLYCNAKCSTDLCVRGSFFMHSECLHWIDLAVVVIQSASQIPKFGSMLAVSFGCRPFKVFDAVVCPVGVDVVDNLSWLRKADESGGHKPMDARCEDRSTKLEGDLSVALNVSMREDGRGPTDIAEIADLKGFFEIGDMDRSPDFFHGVHRDAATFMFRV